VRNRSGGFSACLKKKVVGFYSFFIDLNIMEEEDAKAAS
jgi:hypothetical protein